MSKISIIVPIYNTSKYLSRCLDSICRQTLHDIEIICINDGSTDDSLSPIYAFINRDPRIKLIEFEKNCGPGTARNAGLATANGEYVAFVDSDDKISSYFCERLYSTALSTHSEIVCGGMEQYTLNGKTVTDKERKERIKKNKAYFCSGFTTAIYNKYFLSNFGIQFKEKIPRAEDTFFLLKAVSLCNHITVIDDIVYLYLRRKEGQDCKQLSFDKIISVHTILDEILYFIEKYSIPEYISNIQILYLLNTIFNDMHRSKSEDFIHVVNIGVKKAIKIFKERPSLNKSIDECASVYTLLSNDKTITCLKEHNSSELIKNFIRQKMLLTTIRRNITYLMKQNKKI